jgi:hypothetical protein
MESADQPGEQPETTIEDVSQPGGGLALAGLVGMGIAAFLSWLTFSVDLSGYAARPSPSRARMSVARSATASRTAGS